MAVGDVNNDNLDDLFIGGPYGNPASLYIQTKDKTFLEKKLPTENYEDLGAVFFDLDNDRDLDLFVTSGGSERYENHPDYQDRIYLNDGQGNFTLAESRLPEMLTSTSAVVASDYDKDGDIDLFIGGRVVPGKFPISPQSYLLENNGGKFTDVTNKVCPELKSVGMVTSAIWTDFNNDFRQDLIVVGEMMKISVYQNDGNRLRNISDEAGLKLSSGIWNSIESGDFDHDGDMDYVIGNIGKNTPFEANSEHPLKLHFADFDKNGSIDPIYSGYQEKAFYPLASLDLLTQQLPKLKNKILHYSTYAESTTEDILKYLETPNVEKLTCAIQASVILENLGNNQFSIIELPLMAQIAPVKGILTEDLNLDGFLDILLVGNEYNTEVVNGRYDASKGAVLFNNGQFSFEVAAPGQSAFHTKGDTRSMVKVRLGQDDLLFLIGKNNGKIENYQLTNKSRFFAFQKDEISALIEYQDRSSRKIERHLGSGYLSQQSPVIRLASKMEKITFFNFQGEQIRMIDLKENI